LKHNKISINFAPHLKVLLPGCFPGAYYLLLSANIAAYCSQPLTGHSRGLFDVCFIHYDNLTQTLVEGVVSELPPPKSYILIFNKLTFSNHHIPDITDIVGL